MRFSRAAAAAYGCLIVLAGCASPSSETTPARSGNTPQTTDVAPAQPLRLQRTIESTSDGRPIAILVVDLARTPGGEISIDATFTNASDAPFRTTAKELLVVRAGPRYLYGGDRQPYGGDPLGPRASRAWDLRLAAPREGELRIVVTNWLPDPRYGSAAEAGEALELRARLEDLPRL